MIRRLNAAWSAFRNPEPTRIQVTVDGAEMAAAIRKHQRRNGRPPTI